MWKLTIEDDEGKQTSLPLAHEEYGLGRAETNAIRLTDRNVSRSHALLKKNGQGWFLQDMQSYNGTYVNGTRVVGEQLIHSGDIVQLGDYRLELQDESAGAITADQSGNVPAAPTPLHQRPNRLVVVVGPTPGAEFPLDRDHFTIGRSEEATISINHSSVSRVHAEVIAIGSGRFEIVDKASANGIRINGVELKRGILEAGDALELGDVRLRFVGAGKIYKAFTDHSAQIHPAVAVGGFESLSTSVRAPAQGKGPSIAKLVGIGMAVGLLAILILVVVTRVGGTSSAQQPSASAQPSAAAKGPDGIAIAEAKALLDKKDFEGAHQRLQKIPDGSPARDEQAFKDILNAWAENAFRLAEKASDKAEKKKLLFDIGKTTGVDPDLRKKAIAMLKEMGEEPPPPDPTPPPQPGGASPGAAAPPPPDREARTPTPGPMPAPGGAPKPAPTAAVPSDLSDEERQMKQLEPKVWAGKASENEIRLLKAICTHLGNRDCSAKAAALLKKKQSEGQQ